jgi:hypothetical protein
MKKELAIARATEYMSARQIAFDWIGGAVRMTVGDRPHWAVTFGFDDPPGFASSPGCSIILVYDDGSIANFEAL